MIYAEDIKNTITKLLKYGSHLLDYLEKDNSFLHSKIDLI